MATSAPLLSFLHTPSAMPQSITRAGEQPSAVGPADFFTGRVRVDPVWPADGKNVNWMEKVSDEQYQGK